MYDVRLALKQPAELLADDVLQHCDAVKVLNMLMEDFLVVKNQALNQPHQGLGREATAEIVHFQKAFRLLVVVQQLSQDQRVSAVKHSDGLVAHFENVVLLRHGLGGQRVEKHVCLSGQEEAELHLDQRECLLEREELVLQPSFYLGDLAQQTEHFDGTIVAAQKFSQQNIVLFFVQHIMGRAVDSQLLTLLFLGRQLHEVLVAAHCGEVSGPHRVEDGTLSRVVSLVGTTVGIPGGVGHLIATGDQWCVFIHLGQSAAEG